MARFKVVTPEGVSFGPPGVGYEAEMEALGPVGAEIVEIPPGTEEEFIRVVMHAPQTRPGRHTILEELALSEEDTRLAVKDYIGVVSGPAWV